MPTQFRKMVVANYNGAPVHLGDLGRVYDDVQNDKNASWYNGERAIVLAVMRQPGTNTVAVADAVKAALAEIAAVAAAVGERRRFATTAPRASGSSVQRREVLARAGARAGRDGDLPLPAESSPRR